MPKLITLPSTTSSNPKSPKQPKPGNGKSKSPSKKPDDKLDTGSSRANDKKASKTPPKEEREVLYPKLDILLYANPDKEANGYPDLQPLTGDDAKEVLGWSENPGGNLDFKNNFLLTDRYSKKVRCTNNQRNRPFSQQLADDYCLEILRKKWRLNGETIILDRYGEVQSGQHRLIGLVLAAQEWHRDQTRPKGEQLWQASWPEEPTIETVLVAGIEAGDDVLNTLDTGRPRTFVDALYRSEWFKDSTNEVKLEASKSCNWALKFVWDRTQRGDVSLAPRRPHSESFEFLAAHPKLVEAVHFIREEGDGKKITQFLPLGYAAGLLYLMGSAASDADGYAAVPNESSLDWKLWDKAEEFWVDFCGNESSTEPLIEALTNESIVPPEVGGSFERNLKVGIIIKAWLLYSNKKKITIDAISIPWDTDKEGRLKLMEAPRIGGIDVEYATEDEVPPLADGEAPPVESKATGECPKGGDHDWRDDEDGTPPYCANCLEPQTVKRPKSR